MNPPSREMLNDLRRAVTTQRRAREALDDLRNSLSANQFSKQQQQELVGEIVSDLDLRKTLVDRRYLDCLIRILSAEAP